MKSEWEILKEGAEAYFRLCERPEYVFTLNMSQAVLIIIDMQNFVCSPRDGRSLQGLEDVITTINHLVDACRKRSIPVIWLRHHFEREKNKDNTGLYPLFHKKPISEGMYHEGKDTEIYSGMHLDQKRDHIIFKNRYSAFASGSSDLKGLLETLKKTQLWICGVATNVCVESTARDAMQQDLETVIIADATTSSFELIHKVTLLNFSMFYGDVRRSEELLSLLEKDNCQKSGELK